MLVTGIKSKPVYAPLQADVRGRYHLMLGMGVGGAPLLRVIEEMRAAAAQSLKNTRVLFVSNIGNGTAATGREDAAPEMDQFAAASVGDVQQFAAIPALLERFRAILGQS